MATEDSKAAAMKARVLTHMTKDHSDSLALFLNHYSKVPTSLAPTPRIGTLELVDITNEYIIIKHPQGRNLVKINPPMNHPGEARARLVEMHKECLKGLDMAEFKVDKFVLPNKAWQWITYAATLLCFIVFPFWPKQAFLPGSGSFAYKIWSLGGLWPDLARFTAYVKDWVLLGMLAIHATEAGTFAQNRLRKYWVPTFSPVWWMWEIAVFVGGVAAQWRFDSMVKSMERERAKDEKH